MKAGSLCASSIVRSGFSNWQARYAISVIAAQRL